MTVTGPTFIALQVRDVERAAGFYETRLGLKRTSVSPPGAVVFATEPAAFAVREPLPGVDLDAARPHPGIGVALWLHADVLPRHERRLDTEIAERYGTDRTSAQVSGPGVPTAHGRRSICAHCASNGPTRPADRTATDLAPSHRRHPSTKELERP